MAALNGAGIATSTIINYLLDLVFGGPTHDWGNLVSVEIRKLATKIQTDPIGFSMDIAVDVTMVTFFFKILAWVIKLFGGKTSMKIAPGVTWRWA